MQFYSEICARERGRDMSGEAKRYISGIIYLVKRKNLNKTAKWFGPASLLHNNIYKMI
jgi:hypothetical protein